MAAHHFEPRLSVFSPNLWCAGVQVSYIVRQMVLHAVVSGCRYGMLTDVFHLIVFRFETEIIAVQVGCKLALTIGRCLASCCTMPWQCAWPRTCLCHMV